MSKPADPKLIGAFVLGAALLIIVGLVVVGGGKFFKRTVPVVMYFQGSVSGLSAGSAVHFRGVRLGQVTNVYIRYQPDSRESLIIPVLAELNADNLQFVLTDAEKKKIRMGSGDTLRALIDQGLRAQLALPSLVTGQATVSLDLFPGTPANLVNFYPDRVEIPTVPSTLQEVQTTLQQLYDKFSQLPLEELVEDTRTLVKGANRLVNDPAVTQAIANASQAMMDLQQAARALDSRIGPMMSSIETTSATANRAMQTAERTISAMDNRSEQTLREVNATLQAAQNALTQVDRTLRTANSIIQPTGSVNFEAVNALRETAAAARSLRELTDQLQRNPNSLLFGRPAAAGNR